MQPIKESGGDFGGDDSRSGMTFSSVSPCDGFADKIAAYCSAHDVDPIHVADVVADMAYAMSEYICFEIISPDAVDGADKE